MILNNSHADLVLELAQSLRARDWMVATAESCTGGAIGECLTQLTGASHWYAGGVVSYINAVKINTLGVDADLINQYGAVSEPVVSAMSRGILDVVTDANISVAVSGIAGPGGGSTDKPVGSVYCGWCVRGCSPDVHLYVFSGDRQQVREQTVCCAIQGLIARVANKQT